ncbi:virulence protein RhuM/Fic/DOC family protein [Desulfobulbus rhabdoformis]|uniref:virulence protein RhuM/Fic/DOC family protein n=1 Tax=Desulfobulbus rhabdoformis TaxID=34032 RepID=UPI001F053D40|nr:virulence protein RhuM/Fic/DOC family protein [Desulfobulbus rhabdoformis]
MDTVFPKQRYAENKTGIMLFYKAEDGKIELDVRLQEETVWLSLRQMAELFDRDKSVISRHLRNVFREGELMKAAVVAKNATTAADGKTYQVDYYNLDAIISVGYRVNSKRGTQFRIWASSILKEYLIKGYALNQQRLQEQGVAELRGALDLIATTLEQHHLTDDTGLAVVQLVRRYGLSWRLLLQYDEDQLALPASINRRESALFDLAVVRESIVCLRSELAERGEATGLFGQERGTSLEGILGAIHQTFGGQDLYSSIEEKAAHLLYFVIKDHPFSDGNKRIGSFLFLLYLQENGLADTVRFDNKALVALALLVAASDPAQKELLIRLIVNLLVDPTSPSRGLHHD